MKDEFGISRNYIEQSQGNNWIKKQKSYRWDIPVLSGLCWCTTRNQRGNQRNREFLPTADLPTADAEKAAKNGNFESGGNVSIGVTIRDITVGGYWWRFAIWGRNLHVADCNSCH